MKKIGIISDTHAWWDDRYALHFADCDEIWHAGDIGSEVIIDRLEDVAPVKEAPSRLEEDMMPMYVGVASLV